jgi:hypothetical protein
VLGVRGEGEFFERQRWLDRLPPPKRAWHTARCIRDDGVRALLREDATPADMSIWKEITPRMKEAAARGATAAELYALGMRDVLERFGKERWAQKATSYIFSAEDILATFPRARLIFLVRNPLDLAASTARRNGSFRHTVRLAMGWNRGVREALRLQAEVPAVFRIVRYEDLVRDSQRVVREVCAFCALAFDVSYLDVPHVNKSDTPYNKESQRRGLSASRVYYYHDMLSSAEEAAVRLAVDTAALRRLYPELVASTGEPSPSERFKGMALLAGSAGVLVAQEGKRLAAAPSRNAMRIAYRLRGGLLRS